MKKRYYVAGGLNRARDGMWWAWTKPENGWANFLVCKTMAHALAQFKRVPVKYRHMDLRSDGKAECIAHGKWRKS